VTVKLELSPDVEAGLLSQAQMEGLSLEAYLEQLLRRVVQKPRRRHDKPSLARLFAESPLKGLDLKFERENDTGRPVSL
jgi:hypothetical protein